MITKTSVTGKPYLFLLLCYIEKTQTLLRDTEIERKRKKEKKKKKKKERKVARAFSLNEKHEF